MSAYFIHSLQLSWPFLHELSSLGNLFWAGMLDVKRLHELQPHDANLLDILASLCS